jgi:hypothetical protein
MDSFVWSLPYMVYQPTDKTKKDTNGPLYMDLKLYDFTFVQFMFHY